MGFEEFTDIQRRVIPLIQEGKDVIGHSQTGTGKTAAYAIPMLESLDMDATHIQALILCPTRELAVQVKQEIDTIGKYIPTLKTVAVYGGESISKQIQSLKHKPQIIVGTPGRTIDHINRKLLRLENLTYFVLDEADEMLKMGFIEDVETILENTNSNRQTVMFSATMPQPIVRLTKRYMKDPELISVVTGEEANKDITQYYYQVQEQNKVEAVARLLHVYNPNLTLIFCNTKRKVDTVCRELTKKGYNVDKIHGDLQQSSRLEVLAKFHTGTLDMLVATDVAARGLDIKNVEAVINFDVPEKAEYYIHRIGRTGRIGNKGYSFTLVSRKDLGNLEDIFQYTQSTIKKRNIPTPDKVSSVRLQKQAEEIQEVIDNINTNPQFDLAEQLLLDNEPMDVIKALLYKLQKIDSSERIDGDINETYEHKRRSKNADTSGRVRYHLNVGKMEGVTPRSLAQLVAKTTKLHNSQIEDIAVTKTSSFFSTKPGNQAQVMKAMSNVTIGGKRTSIRLATTQK